jgi:hypothetical protein
MVEWLKVQALSSKTPVPQKRKEKKERNEVKI